MAKKLSPNWQGRYLAALEIVPVLGHAAKAAGVSRTTAWKAAKADPNFAQQVQDAQAAGVDAVEAEAFSRAVYGWDEPLTYQGKVTPLMEPTADGTGEQPVLDEHGQPVPQTVRRYSDQLLVLILKGHRKEVYSSRVELTGANGAPVVEVDVTTRALRVRRLMQLADERKGAGRAAG